MVIVTEVPGVSRLPGAGSWLNTVCGGLSVVDVTTCATDEVAPVEVSRIVVEVVDVGGSVLGGAVVVTGRVVVVVGGRVVVVGVRVVVVVSTE
jgi:hypothetical protein